MTLASPTSRTPGAPQAPQASKPSEVATPSRRAPNAEARTFCRAVLPRVSRTFALNIRLLGGSMADSVRVGYLLCRIADTIEDAWPGDRREIERRFDQLLEGVEGDAGAADALAAAASRLDGRASADHVALVARTPEVLRAFASLAAEDRADLAEAVRVLATGMRRYAGRAAERDPGANSAPAGIARIAYLDDEAELTDYCWIVAGCVGVMLTRLFGNHTRSSAVDARRLELAPSVGEGLQLTNILLDWPSDIRSGRCHVPASWLAESGLEPRDLVGSPRPEISGLAARLERRALAALARVPDYLATIPSRHARYRMFCLWPALWAAASLRHSRRDPRFPWGPERPKLPKSELWSVAGQALVRGHSAAGVSALFGRLT